MQIYVVVPNWGAFEGFGKPIGAYTDQRDAYAAIGMAVIDGRFDAGHLRVVSLVVGAVLKGPEPKPKPVDPPEPA